MEIADNEKKEITMDAGEANVKALVFIPPILFIFGLPYALIWGNKIANGFMDVALNGIFLTLLVLFLGVILHELIHGLFWSFFLKNGFRSIKFGVMWKFLTPYCHSKEPLKLKHYRIGAIMPAIILGFLPALISLYTGNFGLFIFGVFFSIAAGGDLLMIWILYHENRNIWVQDHPDKIGCFVSKDLQQLKSSLDTKY